MKEYFRKVMECIEKSIDSLDNEKFDRLVDASIKTINQGKKIVVSGLGKNVPVCDKFVGTMNSLCQNAVFMNTNTAVHGDIGMVHEGDLVIVLTKSGETAESVYLVKLLQERHVDIWLLTFKRDSTIERMVGEANCIILDLIHESDEWNLVPNNSTTVNLIVLQGLAMCIVKKQGVTIEDFKKNHPGGYIGVQLRDV